MLFGMAIRVWVDDWQMQCCGAAFRIGDEVTWTLVTEKRTDKLTELVGLDIGAPVTHVEEHHGRLPEGAPTTRGVVTAIHAVFGRSEPRPGGEKNVRYPVPGSGRLLWIHEADGWEDESAVGAEHFRGYIVDLDVHR
ncbi:hypothetical protein SAMN02982929_05252 [Saccharopolyspora kobensis]|uniref:Uncharacterized protein n=2 Tax=Saccharopolyspora kobensis TaxID=146035 RepID=A0A1H6E0L6_9PSEU|nr:hypothetical protein SAMN02982929_05252 [Saccharopolyspora kobensis]SFD91976.1 hypothetical protein SAMN05216506_107227 [Saccharopolyspora kobensis]